MKPIRKKTVRRLLAPLVVLAAAAILPASALAHFEGKLVKTSDKSVVVPGDVIVYTMTVTSTLSIPSHPNGTITDELPAGLTFVAASAGCTGVGQSVTCVFAPPAQGESIAFTIQARVNEAATVGQLCNSATLNHPDDTTPDDNTGTVCVTVTTPPAPPAPPTPPVVPTPVVPATPVSPVAPTTPTTPKPASTKLTIGKVATPTKAIAGTRVLYTIAVKNVGAAKATNVLVCDALPAGLTVANRAGGRLRNGQICWTVASLAPGKATSFKLTVLIDRDRTGTIVNSVCAKGDNTARVCATAPITVTAAETPRSGVAGVTG